MRPRRWDEDYAMGVARRPVQWSMAELIDRSAGQSGGKRRTAAPECATWMRRKLRRSICAAIRYPWWMFRSLML